MFKWKSTLASYTSTQISLTKQVNWSMWNKNSKRQWIRSKSSIKLPVTTSSDLRKIVK